MVKVEESEVLVMDCHHIPKIELHCHLDGSVRPKTIIDLAKKDGIELPSYDLEEIEKLSIAPMECSSLDEYLKRFDLPLAVMQSGENIEKIVFELMEDALFENVKYMEIRFAPVLHTKNGMSQEEVIQSAINGIKRAEMFFNIEATLILCCMKHLSEEDAIETIEAGKEFIGKGVSAVDLAGGEEEGFADKFVNAMKLAKEYGYHITVHAGEAASAQNVIDSIEKLGAERIGHGVRIENNEEAYNLVKEKGVMLEICPTSNVQTKAVDSMKNHPIRRFLDDGIKISVNTDNRTVSNTSMSDEFEVCRDVFGFGEEEFRKVYADSVNALFVDDKKKEKLLRVLNQ